MTSQAMPSSVLLSIRHPVRSLSLVFALWKALVFLVTAFSPGPGYDTSTTLLSADTDLSIPLRFARWDSLYFIHIAQEGYVFEQEWAFSYVCSQILALLTSVINPDSSGAAKIALAGVVLSHIAHYFSVLALYRLSINVFGHKTTPQKLLCLVSAALHVISPAGAFLSAPNGEALFSFLNISGFYLYSSSSLDDVSGQRLTRDLKLLTAAVFFGVATTVRSNGILSGFLFAYDALLQLQKIVTQGLSFHIIARLSVIVLGGCVVALGMIVPQFLAYTTYCTETVSRPWCQKLIPSIYGFVQDQYWNVGFLRYWTIPNLPLFLLALPMLTVLCRSTLWALKSPVAPSKDPLSNTRQSLLVQLAVPQGLLAVLAFTSYHVQIINRISSGYPLWYWYLASQAIGGLDGPKITGRTFNLAVNGMVIYALIQGVLFGSFLPPA